MPLKFFPRATPANLLKCSLFAVLVGVLTPSAAQSFSALTNSPPTLQMLVDESPVFSKIHFGFALYDPDTRQFLHQKAADKYFTPASNTKIFTLYTAVRVLGDSLAVLHYRQGGDSLIFWGAANPLFLHPDFQVDSVALAFLRGHFGRLYYSAQNFDEERFGPNWSWADYRYAYQAERAPMPLFGNVAIFEKRPGRPDFLVFPSLFRGYLSPNPNLPLDRPEIRRQEFANVFEYHPLAFGARPFRQARPYHWRPALAAQLLSDTLNRAVRLLEAGAVAPPPLASTLYIPTPDTMYRRLMRDSDNFIAEQLLLMVSDKLYGVQSSHRAIQYAKDTLLRSLPDSLIWHDGSGLSRYNLFTPRAVIGILELLYRSVPPERLFDWFPAGGHSGSIRRLYAGADQKPYVFAKTGTLSNQHCLSGYLATKSGKVLLFSFMHNNFVNGVAELQEEMNKVLAWIRDRF
jgi:D-alanyl-D-alanine carboxypeptidase/D-alanyl-D-alanine-endopeptidase (penicillin-binding protein 4)